MSEYARWAQFSADAGDGEAKPNSQTLSVKCFGNNGQKWSVSPDSHLRYIIERHFGIYVAADSSLPALPPISFFIFSIFHGTLRLVWMSVRSGWDPLEDY